METLYTLIAAVATGGFAVAILQRIFSRADSKRVDSAAMFTAQTAAGDKMWASMVNRITDLEASVKELVEKALERAVENERQKAKIADLEEALLEKDGLIKRLQEKMKKMEDLINQHSLRFDN